jgi:hypothetical protein
MSGILDKNFLWDPKQELDTDPELPEKKDPDQEKIIPDSQH